MEFRLPITAGTAGPTPPEPIYRWVYRPEMQFSVFDLDQKNMQVNVTDSDGQVHNLLQDKLPVVASTADQLQFVYSLISDDLPVLDPFGPDRLLVFGVGDHEIEAIVGPNKDLIFPNLDDVNLLDAEDFLAVRLY